MLYLRIRTLQNVSGQIQLNQKLEDRLINSNNSIKMQSCNENSVTICTSLMQSNLTELQTRGVQLISVKQFLPSASVTCSRGAASVSTLNRVKSGQKLNSQQRTSTTSSMHPAHGLAFT